MRLRTVLVFLLLLIPSAYLVSKSPDMPEFGRLHDDGLFFVSAKSLATGQGFRILSLPEQPAQTKYPILYPLYLSLVWRANPHFPENLALASCSVGFFWRSVSPSPGSTGAIRAGTKPVAGLWSAFCPSVRT
jgi:hypothetical protein